MSLANLRNRQIAAAQDRLLRRFVFDRRYAQEMSRRPLHAGIGEWLAPGNDAHVLELGCGPGKYVAMLSALGFRVTGVDPLEFPTWRLLREHLQATLEPNVHAEHLPFPDNHFDHAVCLGALLYFREPQQALLEMRRVVKPGGRVVVRTVNRDNLYTRRTSRRLDPASRNLYTLAELDALLRGCGFRVCRTFAYGFWPPLCTDLWWYLVSVWMSDGMLDFLSRLLRPEHRINNTVFAVCAKP